MSSTDDAFIKAYKNQQPRSTASAAKQDDATKQRSITIGTKHYRITEFVTGSSKSPITTEVSTLDTGSLPTRISPVDKATRPPSAPTEQPTAHSRTDDGFELNNEFELVELRIDSDQSIVPAPHIAPAAFARARGDQTQAKPSRQPSNPTPLSAAPKEALAKAAQRMSSPANQTLAQSKTAQTARPVPQSFAPAWEVDSFQWPPVCSQLDTLRSQSLSNFVRAILADAWGGAKVVAVTQAGRGEGGTTLSMCLAKWAAMFTGRVALIDGDMMKPRIAQSLGLSFEHGWEETSAASPLAESAVSSIADRLVVLPLGPKGGLMAADPDRRLGREVLQQLASSFELVILDAGPMFDAAYNWFIDPCADAIDSVLIVQDIRQTSSAQVADVRRRLTEHGLDHVSVVENFQNAAAS